jgi:transcriptional regulator with XRE-family HTH domain
MGISKKKAPKGRQILATNMRARRADLGLSQEKLAELADMHRTYISTVERAQRNIGVDGLERIAKALKLSMAELLDESRTK